MQKTTPEIINGRSYVKGNVEGEALVINGRLSLLRSVNLENAVISQPGHEHEGKSIAGKVLVYYSGTGSSGDASRYWKLRRKGLQPVAIINVKADPVHVEGAIISDIPMVCDLDRNPFEAIVTGDCVKVEDGRVFVTHKAARA